MIAPILFTQLMLHPYTVSAALMHSEPKSLGREIAAQQVIREAHARELLGKKYKKSYSKADVDVAEFYAFVHERTKKALPDAWKKQARKVSKTIINESKRYGFDPIFLMAVIENESKFKPDALGSFGEIGLMQIKPDTAEWIAKKSGIAYKGIQSLEDPVSNVKIGAAYLAFLRGRWEGNGRLYLAAYNMGSQNTRQALKRQVIPRIYPYKVMSYYIKFYSEIKDVAPTSQQ